MTHLSTFRRSNPILLDSLIGYGAAAVTRAVPTRKRYASAIGISRQRASKHRQGDTHSPSTKYLVQLAMAEGGTAWPMISEGIAAVIQQTLSTLSVEQLQTRLRELNDLEHTREADENRATCNTPADASPDQLLIAAEKDVIEAELQLERAAIRRELARRPR